MHQDNVRFLQHTGAYVDGDNNETAEHIAACFKPGLYEDIYNAQNCHADELDGLIAAARAVAGKRHERTTTLNTTDSQDSTALESPPTKGNRQRDLEIGDFKGDQRDLEIGDFNGNGTMPHTLQQADVERVIADIQDGELPLIEYPRR